MPGGHPSRLSRVADSVDKRVMSVIGSPIETSVLQAAQAQQVASKARDREKALQDTRARRFQDMVELRVAGMESAEAIRRLPSNDSEEAETEHHSRDPAGSAQRGEPGRDEPPPRIDVQA
jgi:hypothetical protein